MLVVTNATSGEWVGQRLGKTKLTIYKIFGYLWLISKLLQGNFSARVVLKKLLFFLFYKKKCKIWEIAMIYPEVVKLLLQFFVISSWDYNLFSSSMYLNQLDFWKLSSSS